MKPTDLDPDFYEGMEVTAANVWKAALEAFTFLLFVIAVLGITVMVWAGMQ